MYAVLPALIKQSKERGTLEDEKTEFMMFGLTLYAGRFRCILIPSCQIRSIRFYTAGADTVRCNAVGLLASKLTSVSDTKRRTCIHSRNGVE